MKALIIMMLLFACFNGRAQEPPPATQQQLENAAASLDEDIPEDDNYLQLLEEYKKDPLNINTASENELSSLRILSTAQIDQLLAYRKLLGSLISIYELQAVPGWDLQTIQQLLPYVKVSSADRATTIFLKRFKGTNSLMLRTSRVLEAQKGFDTSLSTHYMGDQNHLLIRYRYQYKNLLLYGLTADKDAGEQLFKGSQRNGFDFYSFHFFTRNLGIIKSLALGDYTVNLGQGLIQWQGLAFGKSADVMNIKRQSQVLMPYRAAGEFYFFRGAALTMQKAKFETSLFYSKRKLSGNFVSDTVDKFTSLQSSGYHRTASELADKNILQLTSGGGNIRYKNGRIKLGLNAVYHRFNLPWLKPDEPYNLYAARGNTLANASIDYSYAYKNMHLYGEAATDKNGNTANLHGILLSVSPKADVSIVFRNMPASYQVLFGNAFTENTAPSNEQGIYWAMSVRPSANWQLNGYADFYRFPWLRYRVNAPSSGQDYLLQITYIPDKQTEMDMRFRYEEKALNTSDYIIAAYPELTQKASLRVNFYRQINPALTIKSRMEFNRYKAGVKDPGEGFSFFTELACKSFRKFAGNIRAHYFEVTDYNNRIYNYESDVRYAIAIPAVYGKGFRYYLNINYQATDHLKFWIKLSQTAYSNAEKNGSGLDEIPGPKKTEIRLQLVCDL